MWIPRDKIVLLVPFVYCTLYTTLDLVVVCVAICCSMVFEIPYETQNLSGSRELLPLIPLGPSTVR